METYKDKNSIPVLPNDLIKVFHFTAARKRKIYMYKKVLLINSRLYAVDVGGLGVLPVTDCHRCFLEDCGDFAIIDGDAITHPLDGTMICWWERKRVLDIHMADIIS